MKETETVEEYYTRVIILINQMRLNGESISDRRVVEKVLRSLTRKFGYVVVAIEESKDLSNFSLETLLGTLQLHKLHMRQFDTPVMEHVFQTHSTWESNTSEKQKGLDYSKDEQGSGYTRSKGRGKPFSQMKSFYYDKVGHTIKFCRKRIAEENKVSSFIHKEESHNDDSMFMMLSVQEKTACDLWYLDNGCSNHMTRNKELFLNLEESERNDVRSCDDKKLSVCGCGEIFIKLRDKDKRISNVFYVPGRKHNFLSVGLLILKGYRLLFRNEYCEITNFNNSLIGKAYMTHNKMFPIKFNDENFLSLTMSTMDSSLLWHNRFGHANLNALSYMHKKGLVKGLPSVINLDHVCEGCALGKHTRDSFPQDKA
ncbi:uncharacterized protein LOC112505959 [Cynara cardunculus var. scolymus]|uniref:uncharacterized protein LOC112505959 n=1 Tax=Cynara cardunculus var. scolymus TaxID=59895 RepID=UPI000D62E7A4|nr:uncharacterized protein LOC112505959 [Cynara cardunculus var. scolymus]